MAGRTLPRGVCPVCARAVVITLDGTLKAHYPPPAGPTNRRALWCRGSSNTLPAEGAAS